MAEKKQIPEPWQGVKKDKGAIEGYALVEYLNQFA
jgi:hypothetical protein